MADVIQFHKTKSGALETLDIVRDLDPEEVIIVARYDKKIQVFASEGMDRLSSVGALFVAAMDRWNFD